MMQSTLTDFNTKQIENKLDAPQGDATVKAAGGWDDTWQMADKSCPIKLAHLWQSPPDSEKLT